MTLGEYIMERRKALNMSRNELAVKVGISHTEIHRIEKGERKEPSIRILNSIAEALDIPAERLFEFNGFVPRGDSASLSSLYPSITTEKQKETIEKIIDGLSRNSDLEDESLDDLYNQVEMFLDYAKKKRNSK